MEGLDAHPVWLILLFLAFGVARSFALLHDWSRGSREGRTLGGRTLAFFMYWLEVVILVIGGGWIVVYLIIRASRALTGS